MGKNSVLHYRGVSKLSPNPAYEPIHLAQDDNLSITKKLFLHNNLLI